MRRNYSVPMPMPAKYQQGVVLIVGLVMMLLLTVIGVAAIRGSGLQERMAFNMRERNVTFQAAESGIRDCESRLSPLHQTIAPATCDDGAGMCGDINKTPADATSNGGSYLIQKARTTTLVLEGIPKPPICLIEAIDVDTSCAAVNGAGIGVNASKQVSCPRPYRVTALAEGGEQSTQVLTQSIYTRRF